MSKKVNTQNYRVKGVKLCTSEELPSGQTRIVKRMIGDVFVPRQVEVDAYFPKYLEKVEALKPESKSASGSGQAPPTFPENIKRGLWQLSNGDEFEGVKADAEKAQAKLTTELEAEELKDD